MSPRIVILDADAQMATWLRSVILTHVPTAQVTTHAHGYALLVAYQSQGADLFIFAPRVPDVVGSTLLRILRETGIDTPTMLIAGVRTRETVPPHANTVVLPTPLHRAAVIAAITRALTGNSGHVLAV